jgi:hypothetical protein
MLKRHLRRRHEMTPDQYRDRWGLKSDYPVVAPAYAEKRSELARHLGLGRKGRGGALEQPSAVEPMAERLAVPTPMFMDDDISEPTRVATLPEDEVHSEDIVAAAKRRRRPKSKG